MANSLSISLLNQHIVPQGDFWSLDPAVREIMMVQTILQNRELIQGLVNQGNALKGRIEKLSDQLEKAEESNENTQSTINQICKEKNLEDYKRISEKVDTCFPNKEDVWKQRILEAVLKDDVTARPEKINRAIQRNKNVRFKLREFLNPYGSCSENKSVLLELSRLILRTEPLISWKSLKTKLEKADKTIKAMPEEGVLKISKAAKCLFKNIDIESELLYTRAKAPEHVLYADYYEAREDEWGNIYYQRKDAYDDYLWSD